jgi:polar amino acid transport system permease protein
MEMLASQRPATSSGPPDKPVVGPVRPWRWLGRAVIVVLAAMLVHALFTNDKFEWGVVAKYMTAGAVLEGLGVTIAMTAVVMVLSLVLSVGVAMMRMSTSRLMSGCAWSFIWVFRSTPLLVQLLFWYNLAALFPTLSLGIPFGPSFVSGDSNRIITPLTAAVIGFTLHETAYLAEIVRSGVMSVDRGQTEAATALGMPPWTGFRRIVLPQALRVIVPPIGNEIVSLLKSTSLVSVISLSDLLYSVQIIYARTYQTVPLLIVAAIWYLIITSILSVGQYYVERRFGRGHQPSGARATSLQWRRPLRLTSGSKA